MKFVEDIDIQEGPRLDLIYSKMQEAIFLNSTAKYVVASCGRRSGKTHGAAQYLIDILLGEQNRRVIWVDVQYSYIIAYVEDYFLPILQKLDPSFWSWHVSRRELKILSNTVIFRSADRPDLLVGRGFWRMIINEAGYSLDRFPQLWDRYLAPMLLDYPDSRCWFIGTPCGMVDKDGNEAAYYKFFKMGQDGPEHDPEFQSFKFSSYDNKITDDKKWGLTEEDIIKLENKYRNPSLRLQELYGEFLNIAEVQVFKPEWWQYVEAVPEKAKWWRKFISIDSAFSEKTAADESAFTVWIKTWDGDFYCVDCFHDHLSYPDLVTKVKEMIAKHDPDNLVIENKASGQSLIQTIQRDFGKIAVNKWPAEGERMDDKVTRATSITSYLEAGNVYLLKAPWNTDFVNQATIFPLGSRDDIVDSVSQALSWARTGEVSANPFVTRKIVGTGVPSLTNENFHETIKQYAGAPTAWRGF